MEVVEAMERAAELVRAAAHVDLDGLEPVALHEALLATVRLTHRLHALAAHLSSRWNDRGDWAADGSRSAATRLARETNTSRRAAQRVLHHGRRLAALPATSTALAGGVIGDEHVDLFAAAGGQGRAELLARDEAELVEHAMNLRFDQFVKVLRYWVVRADAELAADGQPPCTTVSTVHVRPDVDGGVHIDAHLDPVDGAEVVTALTRITAELRRSHPDRPLAELRAAALVEMARRAVTADGRPRPRPLVTVVMGRASFARLCELSNGAVLTPDALVPHAADLDVDAILFGGPSHMVTATSRRSFTGALRRAVEVRDLHCQHRSGCDEPLDRCDVDHVRPWSAGGVTELDNGRLLCPFHNRIAATGTRPPPRIGDAGRPPPAA